MILSWPPRPPPDRSSLAICWSFRSSSISIMCRRKQRPPSRKRPLSWGRRPKRSLDSRKPLGEFWGIRGSLGSWATKGPTKTLWTWHGHIWRIISHSQTSPTHFVANASHIISHNLSHMISNIISQTTSQLYPCCVFFSDHIFRRATVCYSSYCCKVNRGTIPQVTQIFGWYKSPFWLVEPQVWLVKAPFWMA